MQNAEYSAQIRAKLFAQEIAHSVISRSYARNVFFYSRVTIPRFRPSVRGLSYIRVRAAHEYLNCPLSIVHYVRVRHHCEQRRQWIGPGRSRHVTTGYGHDAPPLVRRRRPTGADGVGCGMLKRRREPHGCFRSAGSRRPRPGSNAHPDLPHRRVVRAP